MPLSRASMSTSKKLLVQIEMKQWYAQILRQLHKIKTNFRATLKAQHVCHTYSLPIFNTKTIPGFIFAKN